MIRLSRGLLITALGLGFGVATQHSAFANDDEDDYDQPSGERKSLSFEECRKQGYLQNTDCWRKLIADEDDDDEEDDTTGEKVTGDDEGEEEDEDAKDQPAVTAGGLYTMKSYPVRENSRPLTLTQNIMQMRLGLGTDLSAKGAFASFGVNLEAIYGLRDNFNIIGGLTDAYNFKQFGMYVGFEGALYYDIVDIRLAANVHRNAIPNFSNFCKPVATMDPPEPEFPSQCTVMDAEVVNLPNGNYEAGQVKFSIDLGFPFRYAFRPEIAIVALQTLMSIDFNGVSRDHVITEKTMVQDPVTMMDVTKVRNVTVGNKVTPDLNPSLGIATNPIPPLSIVIFAQLRVPDFDTAAGAFQIPVTGRLEFSPNQKLDIGLEFTLLNVKPGEGQSPIDNRFLALFMQARFGK